MQSKEVKVPESFRSVPFEEELERVKRLKEDLDKGDGWTKAAEGPGYIYWIKTYHGDDVPVKILYTIDMPYSGEVFQQLLDPQNLEFRNDWDKSFVNHQCLESYPEDGGYLVYMRAVLSCPLQDRSFILYLPKSQEIDWYGKRATLMLMKNGWHPSKPEGDDGLVRATNGGNFYVVLPDDEQPEAKCKVFGLSSNLYNGFFPKTNTEWLQGRILPQKFNQWRESLEEGYTKYFKAK